MKKYTLFLWALVLCTALLAGCACQHEWAEATCLTAKTCAKCGATEGAALGHCWTEADCENPKTCSRCGLTEGSPLGHTWTEATCTAPKTCTVCAATEGKPLEHTWEGEATLYTAPVCTLCGVKGDPLPGYFAQNGFVPNVRPGVAAEHITGTYVRPDLDTTGSLMASDVWVLESDSSHWPRKGYEWRCVSVTVTFSDSRSGLYGTNVAWARADYYQDQELKPTAKQERFKVNYQGKDYQCLALYENVERYYTENGTVFQMSCFVQVPVGYDGVVLAFYHSGLDAQGKHLHELDDENMLLLRMAE